MTQDKPNHPNNDEQQENTSLGVLSSGAGIKLSILLAVVLSIVLVIKLFYFYYQTEYTCQNSFDKIGMPEGHNIQLCFSQKSKKAEDFFLFTQGLCQQHQCNIHNANFSTINGNPKGEISFTIPNKDQNQSSAIATIQSPSLYFQFPKDNTTDSSFFSDDVLFEKYQNPNISYNINLDSTQETSEALTSELFDYLGQKNISYSYHWKKQNVSQHQEDIHSPNHKFNLSIHHKSSYNLIEHKLTMISQINYFLYETFGSLNAIIDVLLYISFWLFMGFILIYTMFEIFKLLYNLPSNSNNEDKQ